MGKPPELGAAPEGVDVGAGETERRAGLQAGGRPTGQLASERRSPDAGDPHQGHHPRGTLPAGEKGEFDQVAHPEVAYPLLEFDVVDADAAAHRLDVLDLDLIRHAWSSRWQ